MRSGVQKRPKRPETLKNTQRRSSTPPHCHCLSLLYRRRLYSSRERIPADPPPPLPWRVVSLLRMMSYDKELVDGMQVEGGTHARSRDSPSLSLAPSRCLALPRTASLPRCFTASLSIVLRVLSMCPLPPDRPFSPSLPPQLGGHSHLLLFCQRLWCLYFAALLLQILRYQLGQFYGKHPALSRRPCRRLFPPPFPPPFSQPFHYIITAIPPLCHRLCPHRLRAPPFSSDSK